MLENSDFHKENALDSGVLSAHVTQDSSPKATSLDSANPPNPTRIYKAPDDYKFHCFGEQVFSETIIDRGIDTRCTFFDRDWNPMPVKITYDFARRKIEKPAILPLMLEIAEKLYAELGYVRCDFYLQHDRILHIGELTFTPGGGCLPIAPREWDKRLGNLWR